MRTRRLFVMASGLTILGLLLASCAPALTPTPTAKPAAPAPTTAPAAAPTQAPPAAATPKPAAPAPTPKPAADQPRSGGIVTRVMTGDIPSYDLQREQAGTASATLFNVYQGLVRIHPTEWTIVPELAEKWEVSPDGRSYTFKFFSGVKWHDGQPLTPDDVKYSLERMHNPEAFKTISPRGKGLLARMDTVEVTGPDTVKLNLKNAFAPFVGNLATGWVAIQPKHVMVAKGDMRRDAIGTGAFKLKDNNPGVGVTLQKNGDYFVKGLPYLDGIQFYIIRDAATRFSAFRTGKVKVTYLGTGNLTPAEAAVVRADMKDTAVVYEHDAQSRHAVTFNLARKPFDDVRVRKAAHLAFDRQAAIKINGIGYLGSIYVSRWSMPPEEVQKLPGFRQPKDADIAEARKLMAEAGYPNGFKTTLTGRPGGATEHQAVFAKDQMAKIGIEVELVLADQATVLERAGRGAFDMLSYNWLDNTDDPDEPLNTYYVTGGSRNFAGYSDKMVDDLIAKQATIMDEKARRAALAEIEKKILDDVPMVISFWDIQLTGAWKEVKNFKPMPGMHPWGKFDMMWLAK
ncbi:MAG: hypothetical protein HYX92_16345 [Chloroflexi bacterium]|nr:hypothetical protein [Chloroflexota bacterium]